MPPEILNETVLHKGWGRYLRVRVRLPGGETVDREMEDHGAAVCVLPYDPDRKVATFVRQFRMPVFRSGGPAEMLEAPAGLLEDEPENCARREAMEETGIRLGALEPVVTGWTMPGISTELMYFFLATYSVTDKVEAGGGLDHEHENITVVEIPLTQAAAMARAGEITDVKTLMMVLALQVRRPDLFA